MEFRQPEPSQRGRGTSLNPASRFERIDVALDEESDVEPSQVPTTYLADDTKSALSKNDSPDLGFNFSLNPYRGCEHGCIYCYARKYHEYLGLSAGLDFETKIFVKPKLPELLRTALMKPSWRPQPISLSGATDPYQPIERKLEITRGCLKVLAEFRNPVGLITKSALVARDTDVLQELAKYNAVRVSFSITTLDPALHRAMEPRASTGQMRLEALAELNRNGIPAGVNIGPLIPGLNDHEVPSILEAAAQAGARWAHYSPAHLPGPVVKLFDEWLLREFPNKHDKVMRHIRALHGGDHSSSLKDRMTGYGEEARQMRFLFVASRSRAGIPQERNGLSVEHFVRPSKQGRLF